MKAVLVEVNEQPRIIDIEDGLEPLQEAVGGYISAEYPFSDSAAIICNDASYEVGLSINRPLLNEKRKTIDIMCGNFLVVGVSDDDFCDLTDAQADRYVSMFSVRYTPPKNQ